MGMKVRNQLDRLQASAESFRRDAIQKKQNTGIGKSQSGGLPSNLKAGLEHLAGYSMDNVKMHHNSDKPAQLQTHAYAQGTDIHLPHEAWHVIQQKSHVNEKSVMPYHGPIQRVRANPGEKWIYHIAPQSTFLKICKKKAIVPLNSILDKSNPASVSSGLDAQRGESKHETLEEHEKDLATTKAILEGLKENDFSYGIVKDMYEDQKLGRKRDFVYGTVHAHRIDSYRDHYEKGVGERNDLVVLRWKGGDEEYHDDKQDNTSIKTLEGVAIERCEVTKTVPRTDNHIEAEKVLDEAEWMNPKDLYKELMPKPKAAATDRPPFSVSIKNQYSHTNGLLGRNGTSPDRATLSQQDAMKRK